MAAYIALAFVGENTLALELETISGIVGLASTPIAILGLYGLIENKKFLFQKFWIVFFFVIILNEVLYGGSSLFVAISEYEMNLQAILLLAGIFMLLLPYYIGIYIYAVKKDFWYE